MTGLSLARDTGTSGPRGRRQSEEICSIGGDDAPQEKITAAALLHLIEAYDYRCAYTGVTLTPETASIDHTVPIKDGGENHMSNLKPVHQVVNVMKGTMTESDFIDWCKKVARHSC